MGTVYAQHSCAVGQPNGGTVYLTKGQAYDQDHPVVRAKPHLFEWPQVDSPDAEAVDVDRPQKRAPRRSDG